MTVFSAFFLLVYIFGFSIVHMCAIKIYATGKSREWKKVMLGQLLLIMKTLLLFEIITLKNQSANLLHTCSALITSYTYIKYMYEDEGEWTLLTPA